MSSLLHSHHPFRIFAISTFVSIVAVALVWLYLGWEAALITLMLMVIEITFSFDNAIINARILSTMSPFWQRIFLTIGILIAVFGMRVVFPIVLVMLTSGLSWNDVINLALNNPERYAAEIHEAHPSIAAFGGMFLLMLTLHFFFDNERKVSWIGSIERPLQLIGRKWLHSIVCLAVLIVIYFLPINDYPVQTLQAGIAGITIYLIVHGASELLTLHQQRSDKKAGKKALQKTGLAGLAAFLYLEVLDASFSLDGVIGAFAVTKDVVLIAVGLGIGAVWVRSMTVFLVRRKTLHTYRYLEHGAHYVIGILSVTLLAGIFYEIPEAVAGLVGVAVIGLAVASSVKANKQDDDTVTL